MIVEPFLHMYVDTAPTYLKPRVFNKKSLLIYYFGIPRKNSRQNNFVHVLSLYIYIFKFISSIQRPR